MDTSNWQVVVVEDEADSMELVCGVLEHYGIASVAAETGEDAVELLNRLTPTMLIIDLALPQLDGWGVLQAVRSNPVTQDVPCVAITAYYTPILASRALKAGFDACFPKPLNSRTFIADLYRIMES
ncbi:MAG: response regulator [Anaerolineae bacterium]|nr:response regulator [Anaerolineae bacterium]